MSANVPRLTVIVCTYNRCELLRHCLEALDHQDAPPGQFAVVVVNNFCSDGTSRMVADHATTAPYVLCEVVERQQGTSHARNRGVRESATAWVAFLDDDVRPHAGWVGAVTEFLDAHPDAAVFGGPYLPAYLEPPPAWLPAEVGRIWHGDQVLRLPHGKCFLAGGNLVVHRRVFETVGLFDTSLGPKGKEYHYGEDTAFYRQAISHGLTVYYTPHPVVDHLVHPGKYRLAWHATSLRELGANLGRRLGAPLCLAAATGLAVLSPLLALMNFAIAMDVPLKRRIYFALHPLCYAWGLLAQTGRFLGGPK